MKRFLVYTIIATVCTAAYAALPRKVADVRDLTVLISSEGFGGTGRGTGVLLDSTHVLTCAHVADTPGKLLVYTYPLGAVIPAHGEVASSSLDLAIITLESSVTTKGEPVFADAEDGDAVTVIGNALGGMHWFVSRGVISGAEDKFLYTDALVNPGNSGGPWVNDKGEIVAITAWRIGPSEEHHYPGLCGGVRGNMINLFLKLWKIQQALGA